MIILLTISLVLGSLSLLFMGLHLGLEEVVREYTIALFGSIAIILFCLAGTFGLLYLASCTFA